MTSPGGHEENPFWDGMADIKDREMEEESKFGNLFECAAFA